MAEAVDLKHMVMSFRVSELQVLLGFAGRNKSGRKQELMARTLSLLQKGCSTPVQIKIRELYRRRFPGKITAMSASKMQPVSAGIRESPNYVNRNIAIPPPAVNNVPIHPDVRLKHLPFYDNMAELLKPSSLVARGSSRFQEGQFVFHLTPQQAQDIVLSRDVDYNVQIQMRFSLLETSCAQEDNFPPSICVSVNSKMATLPNPIPTNKPGVEPKRPSRPVNITPICRISPTVTNHINVSWASELGRNYCVAVYLVKKLSSDILLSRLKNNGHRHPDFTRALIKDKLKPDPDSEIATTSLRVSLNCPLGKMRMSVPCRASTCNHLQCFDAPMYLLMNEKKPTWVCPVCDKPAEFTKLVIDGLFKEILKTAPLSDEIEFFDDGTWKCKYGEKSVKAEMSPSPTPEKSLIMMVEDSPMTAVPSTSASSTSKTSETPAPPKRDVTCIDLTETDGSDEEDDLPTVASSSVASVVSASSSNTSSRKRPPSVSLGYSSSEDTDSSPRPDTTKDSTKDSRCSQPADPIHSVDDDSLDLANYDLYNLLTANGDSSGQFDFLKPSHNRIERHKQLGGPLPTLTLPEESASSSYSSPLFGLRDNSRTACLPSTSSTMPSFPHRSLEHSSYFFDRSGHSARSQPVYPDLAMVMDEDAMSRLSSILDSSSSHQSRGSSSPDIIPLD